MKLNERISAAFEGGARRRRELRLSPQEAAQVADSYPVQVSPMGGGWYEITFIGRF